MTATDNTISEKPLKEESSKPGTVRAIVEVVAVCIASFLGMLVGSMTNWLPMAPILGMVFPIILASVFLQREGKGWRDLGFPIRMSWGRLIGYTFVALLLTVLANALVVAPLLSALDAPKTDISLLTDSIEDDTLNYVVFMIFIVWGSAGFGEELIARGFILNRLSNVLGTPAAVVAQAAVFGLAHSYQGISGMVMVFVLAIVFGAVYIRCGRNLWPVILAHGIMDSIGITAIYLGYGEAIVGG